MPRFEPRFCDTCPACSGLDCKGGGNRSCAKRDPKPSRLYGIIDTYGGIRFVVTHRNAIKHHIKHDELLIAVPNLKVHEPIAWNDIPIVIARIELTVANYLKTYIPNDPTLAQCAKMYRLRCLESRSAKGSLNLSAIVET
jgi:hypothetical protein